MQTSYGVFVQNSKGQWLLGHVTGNKQWDIFKGLPEAGETPIETALRELKEETGLVLPKDTLVDTGIHSYLPKKSLGVFMACVDNIELSSLQCTSMFTNNRTGQEQPELNAFAWFDKSVAQKKVTPRMWAVLDNLTLAMVELGYAR